MGNNISSLIQNYLYTNDEKYFKELLEKFSPLIKSYARKLYYLEYDDSVQELSIALFEAIAKMKTVDNEYACISYIKKSIIHKFTKLYRDSTDVQSRQNNTIILDSSNNNNDYPDNFRTDNCITHLDFFNFFTLTTSLSPFYSFLQHNPLI